MTVLVTGGGGYIGSHMALRLGDAGEPTVVLDNFTTGFDWAVDHRATLVTGDAGDMEFVGGLIAEHGITEIIHFAGSIVVPESVTDPLKYYRNNTATSRNLLEAAVKGGVQRFIFSSTAAVYGMTGLAPVEETTPLSPMSPYGRSKLMTEWMLADVAAAHPIKYGVLRYFNVAGADPKGRSGQSTPLATHLIKVAAQTALGQRPKMDIFGTDYPTPDGTCVRDYIHVTDLIEAHKLLLDHLRAGGESTTLNCAYGQGYSVRQVVDTVKAVSGVDFRVDEGPRRAGDPASITATGEKVRQQLGWVPQHADLREMVQTALDWERYLQRRNR
ncbi:MAG: UDP-glucose 4-epimerase GalE [Devosia sp. 67-54]|uniref:UDP-glucose 4-epimerase GalE n=1 Tax=unclassified Devosia TaxID=196773 RepID=UPI0009665335|nr:MULTISPECIES: UDP-glucose 4-epimerase GalE [unclassified Devosia]MBN9305788.1 UDP-glucose 4-epimerase GalE [Devosia sp.]OJX16504.1 MAG: UDP-glucose 4-epimerase GalE [Devosia sp. 67-54]